MELNGSYAWFSIPFTNSGVIQKLRVTLINTEWMRSLFNRIRISWHPNTNTHCCCCWEKECAWFCVQNKGRGSFYQQNFHATIPILNHATFLLTFSQQQQSRWKKTYVKVRIHSAIMPMVYVLYGCSLGQLKKSEGGGPAKILELLKLGGLGPNQPN